MSHVNLRYRRSFAIKAKLKQQPRNPRLPVNASLTEKWPKRFRFLTVMTALVYLINLDKLLVYIFGCNKFSDTVLVKILGDKSSSQERLY